MNLEQRNAELDKKIESTDLPNAVDTLLKDAKSRRRQIKLLALTVAFDVLLTIGFGYITLKTHDIATKADSNSAAIVRSCESTNESRANNKKLWDYILALPPRTERTPAQTEQLADFQAFVDKTFAPRNCSTVVPE